MCDVLYEICMRIPFSKQYRYVTNHLHLYVTNYYIFVCRVTLLLHSMYLSLVNVNTSSNATFTTIVTCHQIGTGPMEFFFDNIHCEKRWQCLKDWIITILEGCSCLILGTFHFGRMTKS